MHCITNICDPSGALLLNLGSLMSRWSNGLWKSTLHRVTNPVPSRAANSRRLSMAFFHKPNYDAVIEVGLLLRGGGRVNMDPCGISIRRRGWKTGRPAPWPPAVGGETCYIVTC